MRQFHDVNEDVRCDFVFSLVALLLEEHLRTGPPTRPHENVPCDALLHQRQLVFTQDQPSVLDFADTPVEELVQCDFEVDDNGWEYVFGAAPENVCVQVVLVGGIARRVRLVNQTIKR